jgi:drug/metabolite transporter (DMT)-like permease
MSTRLDPRLQVLTAALLFSTGGVAVKSCSLTSWQIASFRCAVAAVAMLVLLPAARRRWSRGTVAVGCSYACTLTLFVLANKTTTAANAVFLQSTAPLYVLLLAPRLLGEKTKLRDLVVMAGMAAGLALFFVGEDVSFATAPAPLLGNLIGALSGVSWAATVMGLRWLERRGGGREGGAVAVVAGSVLASLISLPLALPVVSSVTADWLWIAYLGIFQIAAAYILLTSALAVVPALEASLLILLEPVASPVWAYLVHGEVPGPWAITGGALIVAVTVAKSFWDHHRER